MNPQPFNLSPVLVPLASIIPNPYQVRNDHNSVEIGELAGDIAAHGLQHFPAGRLVESSGKPADPSQFRTMADAFKAGCKMQLAFGHRRWAAFNNLAMRDPDTWGKLPVSLIEASDAEMAIQAWSENFRRKDLTPIEQAKFCLRLVDTFRWDQGQIADRLGVDRSRVSNLLALLKEPENVQAAVHAGTLSQAAAESLRPALDLAATTPAVKAEVEQLVDQAAAGMTRDEVREKVASLQERTTKVIDALPFLDQVFPVDERGIKSATCSGCNFKIHAGDRTRCKFLDCLETKRAIYETEILERASNAIDITIARGNFTYEDYTPLPGAGEGRGFLAQDCRAGLRSRRPAPDPQRLG